MMKFGTHNIWMGNEDSLNAVMRLNAYIDSPTESAKSFLGYDDEEEEEESPRFEGIGSRLIQVEGKTGIINIDGSLTNKYYWFNAWFGIISYDEIRDALVLLAGDTEIEDILLEITTGGGAAHGVNEVAELISKIDTSVKPVHAHTSMYTFSAGMWIASAARTISASPMSEVGSIGVIITMCSYHEMYKKAGVEFKVVRAGKYKALGNPVEPMSEGAIKEAEGKADKLYGFFLDQMVRGRPSLSIATKDAWAEGKTFFADEAITLGMIDEIVSFDNVIAKLAINHDNTDTEAHFSASTTTTTDGDDMAKGTKGTKKTVLDTGALAAAALGAKVSTAEAEEAEADVNEEEEVEETAESKSDGEGEEEADASVPTPAAGFDIGAFTTQLTTQATTIAQLNAEKSSLEKDNLKLKTDLAALSPIACQTVNRLEVALGKGTTDLAGISASVIADKFAVLNETFESSFSVGGPKSARLAEGRSDAENVGTNFCPIEKPTN